MRFNGQMTAAYSYFNWVHHMITDIKLPAIEYDVVEDLWLVQRFVRKYLVKKKKKTTGACKSSEWLFFRAQLFREVTQEFMERMETGC